MACKIIIGMGPSLMINIRESGLIHADELLTNLLQLTRIKIWGRYCNYVDESVVSFCSLFLIRFSFMCLLWLFVNVVYTIFCMVAQTLL